MVQLNRLIVIYLVLLACHHANAFAQCPLASQLTQPFTPPVKVLSTGGEPSGVIWHAGLQRLFVVHDNGTLVTTTEDGTEAESRSLLVPGRPDLWDFEGITVADPSDPQQRFYVAVERGAPAIVEYSFLTMGEPGYQPRVFDISIDDINALPQNDRIEGIAFIPPKNGATSSFSGRFYLGVQGNGCVYGVQLPPTGTNVTYLNNGEALFCTYGGANQDLFFDACHDVLYQLFNFAPGHLVQTTRSGMPLNNFTIGGTNNSKEGISVLPNRRLALGFDDGYLCRIGFEPFPADRCVRCGDGVVQHPEQCDDGNYLRGDGCENNCRFSLSNIPAATNARLYAEELERTELICDEGC